MRCYTTFDNLPRSLWPRYSAKDKMVLEQRHGFLADALFNSMWMMRGKIWRPRVGILGDLRTLVDIALSIQAQNLALHPSSALALPTKEITKRLCIAIALAWTNPPPHTYHGGCMAISGSIVVELSEGPGTDKCPFSPQHERCWRTLRFCRLTWCGAGALCVAVIIGAEDWFLDRSNRLDVGSVSAERFGELRGVVRRWGSGALREVLAEKEAGFTV
jgi:hypothetical protein